MRIGFRTQRSRFAVYVDVGSLPPAKAKAYLDRVAEDMRRDARRAGDNSIFYFFAVRENPRMERL